MIFLNYFLFKRIVSLLTYYFYCHAFYTWASGSDDRGNPIPRIDVNKLIDWLIDWLTVWFPTARAKYYQQHEILRESYQ